MSDFDIRTINLNLLPALEALLETRSVSAAARRVHVSQSAMSHSLSKLRELLGDPVLVRSGRELVLTPRASRIAEALPSALDTLERTVEPPRPFAPGQTRRTFRLLTLDYFEFVMLGDLLAHFAVHAPHAHLWIERLSVASIPALLAGEIDLALVGETSIARSHGLCRAELYHDSFSTMLREGHPALQPTARASGAASRPSRRSGDAGSTQKNRKKALSLESYLAYPHVVVTIEGRPDGAVDRALERIGASRTVALRVPHFATAPLAVMHSDAMCTIATSVAQRARSLYPIELRTPPIELAPAGVCAVWSKRVDEDEGSRWFRELFSKGHIASTRLRDLMGLGSRVRA